MYCSLFHASLDGGQSTLFLRYSTFTVRNAQLEIDYKQRQGCFQEKLEKGESVINKTHKIKCCLMQTSLKIFTFCPIIAGG